jgi:hypothetical protein
MYRKKDNKKVYKKYNLFGLSVSSVINLRMIGKRGKKSNVKGDVHISKGRIRNKDVKDEIRESGHYIDGRTTFYAIKGVGYFMIEKGKKVVVDELKKADKNVVELYLLGICMATILRQRKYIVFHGSCVRVDGKTILFAGPQGAGKSTLAAASTKRGAKIISDDISPAWVSPSGKAKVATGHQQVKLWPKSVDMLGYGKNDSESKKLHEDVEKRYIIIEKSVNEDCLSLDAFCEISKGGQFLVEEVVGGEAIESVCRNLFLRKIPQPPDEKSRQFHEMCKMLEDIKVYDLQRRRTDSPIETFEKIKNRLG